MILKEAFSDFGKAEGIIFFDFDETYYPHSCTEELLKDLYELEKYLEVLAIKENIKIGWITGSDIKEIGDKMKYARMNQSAHFVASNLGTEIYHIDKQGMILPNKSWINRLKQTSFNGSIVHSMVQELRYQYNIKLMNQTQFDQKKYKWNYYYFIQSEVKAAYDLKIIKQLAKNNSLALNVNRCNPKAGDPENAYDVDFIPIGTGKSEAVQFMREFYKVPVEKTIAFGDSGNDIRMLKAVNEGYVLANGTEEAKNMHSQVTSLPYAKGIKNTLEKIFNQKGYYDENKSE